MRCPLLDPLAGTWNSSSSSPSAPPLIPPTSPHLFPSGHLFCPRGPGRECWGHWLFPFPVPLTAQQVYFISRPLHWRPQKVLEGWRWTGGAAAAPSTSGGCRSCVPGLPRAGTLLSRSFLARSQIRDSSLFNLARGDSSASWLSVLLFGWGFRTWG